MCNTTKRRSTRTQAEQQEQIQQEGNEYNLLRVKASLSSATTTMTVTILLLQMLILTRTSAVVGAAVPMEHTIAAFLPESSTSSSSSRSLPKTSSLLKEKSSSSTRPTPMILYSSSTQNEETETTTTTKTITSESASSFVSKNKNKIIRNGKNITGNKKEKKKTKKSKNLSQVIRSQWQRRHARSIEEGIRSEKLDRERKLSDLLQDHTFENTSTNDGGGNDQLYNAMDDNSDPTKKKRYAARTIAGLISALAEEATGLEVQVDARNDTPLWGKQVDELKINFSRLGFKPLSMGGLETALEEVGKDLDPYDQQLMTGSIEANGALEKKPEANGIMEKKNGVMKPTRSAYEIFDEIDVDKSGSLDEEELARALSIASGALQLDSVGGTSKKSIAVLSKLANRLVGLYDSNGDGVVDREEYKNLVEDMTAFREQQRIEEEEKRQRKEERRKRRKGRNILQNFNPMRIGRLFNGNSSSNNEAEVSQTVNGSSSPTAINGESTKSGNIDFEGAEDISNDPKLLDTVTKGEGSIVFSGLKLDLRRLLFGAVPIVKKITPGGPLVLEPFTVTVSCLFNRDDLMSSGLLDDGLRRLVARLLRRRVRSIREFFDGSVWYGRTWNMASKNAPVVEVPKLINIEFDKNDKLIITGRAKIRTAPDQPFVENSFKLRTKLGTREGGKFIRLLEPELALILECPKAWERNIVSVCKKFNLPIPTRPEPLYTFIPLVSPLKKTEQDGFYLGEDNRIKSIYIEDNSLRFEMSAVLRPGRFLGNHYLAFTLPNRTFIITTDRVREGIKVARRNKRLNDLAKRENEQLKKNQASDRYNRAVAQALSSSNIDENYSGNLDDEFSFKDPTSDLRAFDYEDEADEEEDDESIVVKRPGFFSRFLEGYLEAAREETEKERNSRFSTAISEFFGEIDESEETPIKPQSDKERKNIEEE